MRTWPVLVVAALALAGCTAEEKSKKAYPEAYILQADELPAGLKLSDVPPELGVASNPGRVPTAAVAAVGGQFGAYLPDELWAEFVEPSSGEGGGLLLAAGYWASEDRLAGAVAALKSESRGEICAHPESGRLLRDGHVGVLITGDESMSSWMAALERALRADAPDLADVCA